MADQKLMIAARNKKGQIGYLSEGLSLPEFFNLFKQKDGVQVLVDYSPIIEELHKLRKSKTNEDILNEYNAMFNFWQDARTYSKEAVKISKSEELSKQANFLINKLQLKFQTNASDFSTNCRLPLHQRYQIAESIRTDSNIYIDTLLCFIHSKASLDIDSFKKDVVLISYGEFLYKLILSIYEKFFKEKGYGYDENSFLKFIAFEERKELKNYLDLKHNNKSSDQFLLEILNNQKPEEYQNQTGDYYCYRQVSISYGYYEPMFVSMAKIFRDLLHKISSVNIFLKELKEGSHKWDDSSDSMEELREDLMLRSRHLLGSPDQKS